MRELFIYYQVRGADAAAALEAVAAMQDELRASRAGLQARLLVRCGHGDDPQTWMESYAQAGASHDIDTAFEALIEARAKPLGRFIAGARHVEAFDAGDVD